MVFADSALYLTTISIFRKIRLFLDGELGCSFEIELLEIELFRNKTRLEIEPLEIKLLEIELFRNRTVRNRTRLEIELCRNRTVSK